MPFIGKQPQAGAYSKLDAITTSATATYNLTLDSGAYSPQSANHLLVSLNGVIQAPQDSFTVSGSQIIFDSALTSADVIDFIIALGDTLDIGVPSAGSVNTSQLANDAVTTAKIAAGAVDTTELASGAVTSAKLDTNIDIAGTLDVTGATTLDSTLAIAGHGSVGNAGTVAGTRALTVVGATDGTGSSILVGYNSSLAQKFSVRDDGFVTIGNGLSLSDGNLVVASGHGIDFSAGANATGMTSELLDDYEEGSWTPVWQAGVSSPGYLVQQGRYTKIGNRVTLSCYLRSNSGSANGSHVYIGGLPFTATSSITAADGGYNTYLGGFYTATNGAQWLVINSSNYVALYRQTDGAALAGNSSGVSVHSDVRIVISYQTD